MNPVTGTTMHKQPPSLFQTLKASPLLAEAPFIMFDVGCSGGIHELVRHFEPHLRAFGFDLQAREIARLNAAPNKPQGAEYFHTMIVGKDGPVSPPPKTLNSDIMDRSSAIVACNMLGVFETQQRNEAEKGEKPILDEITIDEFAAQKKLPYVDFIKTDTDGFDFSILKSATGLLNNTVLGLQIECALNGVQDDDENLFRNVDKLLQARGFALFDMQLYRYSRAELPRAFAGYDPAQTEKGQVSWCDAFYFRDVTQVDYEHNTGFVASPVQLLKLAAMLELFGLVDCAADILIKFRDRLKDSIDVDAALNAITPQDMGKLSYAEYMGVFKHMMQNKQIYPFGRIKLQK
jgi:FkbM family methyltransferase